MALDASSSAALQAPQAAAVGASGDPLEQLWFQVGSCTSRRSLLGEAMERSAAFQVCSSMCGAFLVWAAVAC